MSHYYRLVNRIIISAFAAALLLAAIIGPRLYARVGAARSNAIQGNAVVSVNGASYVAPLSPGMIASAFGTNLATTTVAATTSPLPTTLAGTSVTIVDSAGVSTPAPLFFVSPLQINYLIPTQVALGTAQIQFSNNGVTQQGTAQIASTNPGIFTVNQSGSGIAAAIVTYDLGRTALPLINPDGSPRLIMPGVVRPSIVSLFGTGFRNATTLTLTVGGIPVTPMFFGAQGQFFGLDQINFALPTTLTGGLTNITVTVNGVTSSNISQILIAGATPANQANALSVSDVQTIIAQGITRAQQLGLRATIAVTDRIGNVLGVFQMTGASPIVTITAAKPRDPDGLEGLQVPSMLAAISKAGTAAFFSTGIQGVTGNPGSSISTRTAGFIVQEHIPPGVRGFERGPLFGVQFSQLPCSDINLAPLPLGLSADLGSYPVYKNGLAAGAVGIEINGIYTADVGIAASDDDMDLEEMVARAAALNFEPPSFLRIDNIAVNGIFLPFVNVDQTGTLAPPFATLNGTAGTLLAPIRATPPSPYVTVSLPGAPQVPLKADIRFGPPFRNATDSATTGANALTASDVMNILTQAANGAFRNRAAIRVGGGTAFAEVNMSVIDTNGVLLGQVITQDAPQFGQDVSVQKARTAMFFSRPDAATRLSNIPDPNNPGGTLARFTNAFVAGGVPLNGTTAFSTRGFGNLNTPFFPDGQDGTATTPGSKPIASWSVFNLGLQTVLDLQALRNILGGTPQIGCVQGVPMLTNGIQPFAGGIPLYRNGQLIGAIGISGDGINNDEFVAGSGASIFFPPTSQAVPPTCGGGLMPPCAMTSDNLLFRGVRLAFVRYGDSPAR